MKLIRVEIEGMELFPQKLEINLYAKQRVNPNDTENLFWMCSNLYLNRTNAFIGINASGKTSVLRALAVTLQVLRRMPLNQSIAQHALKNSPKTTITSYFMYGPTELFKLETVIKSRSDVTVNENKYYIESETLWKKAVDSGAVSIKNDLFSFQDKHEIMTRKGDEAFLSEDVSIIISLDDQYLNDMYFASVVEITDLNFFPISNAVRVPMEYIRFLDPSIEKITIEGEGDNLLFRLKFFGKEEIIAYGIYQLNQYLSSGTIKGLTVFYNATEVLKRGGDFLIDEIENHFNREIVATLIRLFQDRSTNPFGAVLLFSTHYPSLLDEFDRNDAINIVRNMNGIEVQSLAEILKRNDIKKSEAYDSSYLGGTAPSYETYIEMKRALLRELNEGY